MCCAQCRKALPIDHMETKPRLAHLALDLREGFEGCVRINRLQARDIFVGQDGPSQLWVFEEPFVCRGQLWAVKRQQLSMRLLI